MLIICSSDQFTWYSFSQQRIQSQSARSFCCCFHLETTNHFFQKHLLCWEYEQSVRHCGQFQEPRKKHDGACAVIPLLISLPRHPRANNKHAVWSLLGHRLASLASVSVQNSEHKICTLLYEENSRSLELRIKNSIRCWSHELQKERIKRRLIN
jgi:hypothetical protein